MAPYVRRILLRVHAPGSAGGCEEQQERRCAPRYGSVHFSGTTGHLTFHRVRNPTYFVRRYWLYSKVAFHSFRNQLYSVFRLYSKSSGLCGKGCHCDRVLANGAQQCCIGRNELGCSRCCWR